MGKEMLRLFKGYLGEKVDTFNEEALKYGLLIPSSADDIIVKYAIEYYGKDGNKWNQTFHKDFDTVKNLPIDVLVTQQMIHYITTYGFENLGIYNQDLVYIPHEKLEIPELREDIELIVIHPLSEEELTEKLMVLLTSGIALSSQTVNDIMVLSDFIDKNKFDEIKNREVKIALYDKYGIMPKNPDDFFRYLIFKVTGSTLKIKSDELYEQIKCGDKIKALYMFNSYFKQVPNGFEKLSSIFLRNKKLFLAFKIKRDMRYKYSDIDIKAMNHFINKLRKLADANHKPLKENILDWLTDDIHSIDYNELRKILDDVTIFREIRILNGVGYRLYGSEDIVYKIRNGKSYTKKLPEKDMLYIDKLNGVYSTVSAHLIERLSKKVYGKFIYIPNNVTYAAPTSEKQFNGNFPNGSYITIPRDNDMIYGVYWKNIEKNGFTERVDLDLKQMNKSEVFGWNGDYRDNTRRILFSGDMTNAPLPKGASELFYISNEFNRGSYLVTLNMYTQNSENVPFEFVIAKNNGKDNVRKYHVLDPNDIIQKFDMEINNHERQKVLGLISIDTDNIKFYLSDFTQGINVRSSSQNDYTIGAYNYLNAYNNTQVTLDAILVKAGAHIINTPTYFKEVLEVIDGEKVSHTEEVNVEFDLSPNNITKETIIDLLS